MSEIALYVDGYKYGGWLSARVTRSIEQLAHDFELSLTEKWADSMLPRAIRPGAACFLFIDGDPVIVGYVDDVKPSYSGSSHTLTVSGRSKTGDLVDCTAASFHYRGQTLAQLAAKLCLPFGIEVVVETDVGGPFLTLKPNEGDSVFQALDAAARIRGVLLTTNASGDLVITRASYETLPYPLVLGFNIKAGEGEFSLKDRFSQYTLKGQQNGSAMLPPELAARPSAKATDPVVTRHRPLTIIADEPIDVAAAKSGVQFEVNVRAGRSQRVTYTVAGWKHPMGLWEPNVLVPVSDQFLGITGVRLITAVEYTIGDAGEETKLTLMPRSAFDVLPVKEPNDNQFLG